MVDWIETEIGKEIVSATSGTGGKGTSDNIV